jgi:hypothetical protein
VVAAALPLSYSVLALRASVFAGATMADLEPTFLFLAGLILIYIVVTMYFIQIVDVRLRREGSLQLF